MKYFILLQLVNHVIDEHGVAFSGGPSFTGPVDEGHHVEITMLQLYKVALSAGKAHRDHKHHHVHHFDHNGPIEPTTPAPATSMVIYHVFIMYQVVYQIFFFPFNLF